jgi:hypothetical protein
MTCKSDTKEEWVLIYPYTEYFNWTQFRTEHLAIKKDHERLLVDTTYGPESNRFTIHGSEQVADYPSIGRFLGRTLNEFQEMEKNLKETECAPFFQTYIKDIKGQDSVLITFNDITPCGTDDIWTLEGLDEELNALKEKYAR